jgi:hypothetical protein
MKSLAPVLTWLLPLSANAADENAIMQRGFRIIT